MLAYVITEPNLLASNHVVHVSTCLVEEGLMELRKLGIEHRLWEASRKEIDQDYSTSKKFAK